MKQAEVRFNGGDIEVDTSMLDYEGEHRLLCWVHILICMDLRHRRIWQKGSETIMLSIFCYMGIKSKTGCLLLYTIETCVYILET